MKTLMIPSQINKIGAWVISLALLLILPLGVLSCESFVEVETPDSQLSATVVFEDPATARAALAGIYSSLRDTGILTGGPTGIATAMGTYADELDFYGDPSNTLLSFYNNTLLASNPGITSWWADAYAAIYAVNAFIEGVNASASLSAQEKSQLLGEAHFVRALQHFYLAALYGDVPYISTTDYRANQEVSRWPLQSVYQAAIDDLTTASLALGEQYASAERTIPNRGAALALLARVYLYKGDWAEAADAASYIINNGLYSLEQDPENVFLLQSDETIWQFMPKVQGQNTLEGETLILTAAPPSLVALTEATVQSFEAGDLRRASWFSSVSDGNSTWYYANKYKQQSNTAASLEYSKVLRLSEQYLIRAEARALQGDLIGAKEDLDHVRSRAGLAGTPSANQDELLSAILAERRSELFTEFGHRFLDLRRFGVLDAALGPVKPGWNTADRLMPVPETELLLNPNLNPQNTGY